jgi:NAD(P)H-quinone oxidoreductase subunit 5
MHAGFVNAGGILLTRFAPVVSLDSAVMLAIVVLGATSALLGKLLKSVQPSVKGRLGCSTVGQMGFMIVQVGLGFFAAAVTHLILHGFYKAYLFLSAGEAVEHTSPSTTESTGSLGALGGLVTLLAALAGAALFALLTGKGTALDSGLLLTGLVALTTLHATREVVARTDVPATVRYGAVVAVFLPAIAVYALAYTAVADLLKLGGVVATAPTPLSVVHLGVAAAFALAYVAIETGAYRHSTRLYAALVNASRAPSGTALTSTEEYNEY